MEWHVKFRMGGSEIKFSFDFVKVYLGLFSLFFKLLTIKPLIIVE